MRFRGLNDEDDDCLLPVFDPVPGLDEDMSNLGLISDRIPPLLEALLALPPALSAARWLRRASLTEWEPVDGLLEIVILLD